MPSTRSRLVLIVALLTTLALGTALTALAASTPASPGPGYVDLNYSGSGATRATADKPQSKLWYVDGSWWGGLFDTTSPAGYRIAKFDTATQSWTFTSTQLDGRDRSDADYLLDGTSLYMVSAEPTQCVTGCTGGADSTDAILFKHFVYSAGGYAQQRSTYLDGTASTPLDGTLTTAGGTDAVSIAKDSDGVLWVAWPGPECKPAADLAATCDPSDPAWANGKNVFFSYSTDDGVTWASPARLPSQAIDLDPTKPDMVAIATLDDNGTPSIGVMWSSHGSQPQTDYFAIHHDGDAAGTWQAAEVAWGNSGSQPLADNHLNVKTDANGNLWAVTKTNYDGGSDGTKPLIILLHRDHVSGDWTSAVVSQVADRNTRPQLVLDEQLGIGFVVMAAPVPGTVAGTQSADGAIYYKSFDLVSDASDLSFPAGPGTLLIDSSTNTNIDDPSTMKGSVDSGTGLLVEASDSVTRTYLHGYLSLAASDATAPAGTVTIAGGATFTATTSVSVAVPATDAGSGVYAVHLANAAD
ncbi:MAG TPA: hypothetical protein VFW92_11130, partial [Candidatus Limnocylindrales bacterium]|nr:hypothetical protein [Candidatus Limnocylindrales bacterium]